MVKRDKAVAWEYSREVRVCWLEREELMANEGEESEGRQTKRGRESIEPLARKRNFKMSYSVAIFKPREK